MLYDPNVLFLGGEPFNDRSALIWLDAETAGATADLEPWDLDQLWRLEPDQDGDLVLTNGAQSADALTVQTDGAQTTVHHDLRVSDQLLDVYLGSTTTRLDGFDSGIHSLRYTGSDADEIAHIERHGVDDYDLHVFQSGSAERVLTAADDGTFDAATLDGEDPGYYAALSEDETVTGTWTFDNPVAGDITGNAATADAATDAAQLDGNGPDYYAALSEAETVAGAWNYTTAPTIGGDDILLETDDYYPETQNGGTTVNSDTGVFNFGSDLAASDDNGTVTIDFVGGGTPDNIYQDGTEQVNDAAYLDFINDFIVSEGSSGEAQVEWDGPDDIAETTADETITGTWSFDNTVSADIDGNAATADAAGDADQLNGQDPSYYAAPTESETVTSPWTFDNHLDVTDDTELQFGTDGEHALRYSSSSTRLVVEDNSDAATVRAEFPDGGTPNFPSGVESGGEIVGRGRVRAEDRFVFSNTTGGGWIDSDGTDIDIMSSNDPAGYIRLSDAVNGQDILTAGVGGDVGVPNGQLSEQGDRVATRLWVGTNYAAQGHDHDSAYAAATHDNTAHSTNYAADGHTHDSRYGRTAAGQSEHVDADWTFWGGLEHDYNDDGTSDAVLVSDGSRKVWVSSDQSTPSGAEAEDVVLKPN